MSQLSGRRVEASSKGEQAHQAQSRSDRRVLFHPRSRVALQRGANTMAHLLALTLGPKARTVAMTRISAPQGTPEILDDAGTIARRTIEVPDRFVNMGAMLMRHLAWTVREEVGDGGATTVVIARRILVEGARYVAAGGNPMGLRRGLERGLTVAIEALRAQARPLPPGEGMVRLAQSACGDAQMGALLGEIFQVIGSDGVAVVEDSQGTTLERFYLEGVHWDQGFVSPDLATDPERSEAVLPDPLILTTDYRLSTATELLPVLEVVAAAGERNLCIIAGGVRGQALALLLVNKERGLLSPLAVTAPGFGDSQRAILEDIAVLTGGRLIAEGAGDTLAKVQLQDLGRARQAWANRRSFRIVGGKGNPAAVRQRIRQLQTELASMRPGGDRDKVRERLGRLRGGVGILRVGAPSETARAEARNRAEQAVAAIAAANEEGVVPGGGVAYLGCIPALAKLQLDPDETMGLRAMARALEEPTRVIVSNAGLASGPIIARLRELPPGWGFDVMSGQVVDMHEAGILDPTKVARLALETAVSGAGMALTTDVLVLSKRPATARNP